MQNRGVNLSGLIVLLAVVLGCSASGETTTNTLANALKSDSTNWFTFQIHRDLPPWQFHLLRANDWPVICGIEVFKANAERPFQALTNVSSELEAWQNGDSLEALDMNFDGFKDLRTVNYWGVTGNIGYNCWLYDTNAGRFVFSAELSDLCCTRFVLAGKRIYSHANGGIDYFSSATYVWENAKLVMIEEVDWHPARRPIRDWLRNILPAELKLLEYQPEYVRVRRVRNNGIWKVTTERMKEIKP